MSSKQTGIAISGDPRRPHEVYPYQPPPVDPDQPPEPMMLLATLVGLAGLWLRVKVMSWVSLLMIISSFATMKSGSADVKQMCMTTVFAVVGMAMSYLKPYAVAKYGMGAGAAGPGPGPGLVGVKPEEVLAPPMA